MKRLSLTIGDPTGIGPEITVKALQRIHEFSDLKCFVVGSLRSLNDAAAYLKLSLPSSHVVDYVDVENVLPGVVAYQAIKVAVQMIAEDKADAIVTGPISKRNLASAQISFQGHTEILEDLVRTEFEIPHAKAEMLFVHKKFRLMLLTRHIALSEVSKALLNSKDVEQSAHVLLHFLQDTLKINTPRVGVLAVNPHAGEIGGEEERTVFKPMIDKINEAGIAHYEGPFPADAFFRDFDPETTSYDAIISAYHDQGLIPFKMLAGYGAVNMTIGLPFIRTSVSHGTAENIVGKGIAREDSLLAALHTAMESL